MNGAAAGLRIRIGHGWFRRRRRRRSPAGGGGRSRAEGRRPGRRRYDLAGVRLQRQNSWRRSRITPESATERAAAAGTAVAEEDAERRRPVTATDKPTCAVQGQCRQAQTAGTSAPPGRDQPAVSDTSLGYLLRRVGLVEDRIRALVLHRRADDPAPDDPFRGLYLTEEVVDQLLAAATEPPRPDWRGQGGGRGRGRRADRRRRHRSGCARLAAEAGLTESGRRTAGHRAGARPGQPVRAAVRLPERRRHPTPGDGRTGAGPGRCLLRVVELPGRGCCPARR